MDINRNALCPCDSGKKLKHCCLDGYLAWDRAGKGIMVTYVALDDGGRCLVGEWDGVINATTTLIAELNPVTSAWVRHALPDVARFGHPGYRGLLIDHLVALSGGSLSASTAVELVDEFSAARDYLTFELAALAVPAASAAERQPSQEALSPVSMRRGAPTAPAPMPENRHETGEARKRGWMRSARRS